LFQMPAFFLSDTAILHRDNDFAKGEGEMKRQHKLIEDQSPLASGDDQPGFAGRQPGAAGPAASDGGAPYPAPVGELALPGRNARRDDEESAARGGGVCLLIA
jgi:hypothetical protein